MAKATAKKSTKKSAKATATPKKTAKAKAAPKAKADGKKETVRVRALRALQRKDMTASQVKEAIGLSHGLKPTLEQEVERGHLLHAPPVDGASEGTAAYRLSAKGKKALANGTVNPKRGEE